MQSLLDRLDRYERDLGTIQRRVFNGEALPAGSEAIGSPAGGALSGVYASQEIRLSQLEDQLRQLTGQIEEAQHRLRRMGDQFERLTNDYEARLMALEGGGPTYPNDYSASAFDNPGNANDAARAGNAAPLVSNGSAPQTRPTGQVVVARDPNLDRYETMGTLGTIESDGTSGAGDVARVGASAAQVGATQVAATRQAALGGADEQTSYDSAYQLLRQADYDQAEIEFKSFVERFPDSTLSGHAHYWLGETYYVRNRFDDAAVAFARGYKSAPQGAKAPDNLLKLGMTFIAMGKTMEACATFDKLQSDHPDAPPIIQERLKFQIERAGCS